VVVQNADVPGCRPGSPVVIKIHGDTSLPDTIVLTKNDFYRAALERSVVWNKVGSSWAEYCFVFLGYSFRDPDFDQLQAQLLHYLGRKVMPQSYAVLFDSDHVARADLASRNIDVIDLGEKPDSRVLHHFLSTIANRAVQFPIPPSEHHDARQARSLVPAEIQQRLRDEGYCLVGCVEYLVYCGYVDDSPSMIPPGWRPRLSPQYEHRQYVRMSYTRENPSGSNRWEGIAIGRAELAKNA
jgi:hypothetical protein